MITIKPMDFKISQKYVFANKEEIEIPTGITYLIGENGAGKTVFIKSMINILGDNTENIKYDGKSYSDKIKDIRAVFDGEHFIDELTGIENLIYFNNFSDNKVEKSKIKSYYEKWNTDSEMNYSKYSLGMKKRLSITFAFMYEPEFLFLDEPLNALDTSSQNLLVDTLVVKSSENKTIIVTSHEAQKMLMLCDHILLIYENTLYFFKNIEKQRDSLINSHILLDMREKMKIKDIEHYILEVKETAGGIDIKVQSNRKDFILSKIHDLKLKTIRVWDEVLSIKEMIEVFQSI